MYIPQHFAVTSSDEIFNFIRGNSFGQLISSVDGRLFCSHLPFLLSDDQRFLFCHLAKQNQQWECIERQEVLVTFQGAHNYISPSWYNTPGVPTWNYLAAHIYGKCLLISEPEQLAAIVNQLTKTSESSFEKPWVPEYKESMLNEIIGLKIGITEVQCKYKISQNRSEQDRDNIAGKLGENGAVPLSHAMKNEF